ncbi:TAP-like protein-domain-containing protein [Xylariomycetidae sp. FL0641]|nr:TAP-like protein-domain-containing protein [Xylariomycetidae sp. FL0641]
MLHRARLTAALLALASAAAAAPLTRSYPTPGSPSSLTWGACPDPLSNVPNVTCASYDVPLDWSHPDGNETIRLGIGRLEATDPANKIGSLFVNPGGPGGQATSLLASIASSPGVVVAPAIRARFDILALDPRGVGLSTPVTCSPDVFNRRVSFFPATPDQLDALVAYNRDVAASCRARSATPRLLDFVDTVSAARDHEAVRRALLGGAKASFLGLSYGTQLFATYAALYPAGVRAMVLDGNLQHALDAPANLLVEAAAYQATLQRFFAWCAAAAACPLRGRDVAAAYQEVLASARRAPIPAPGCDEAAGACRAHQTEEDVRFNVQGLLLRTAAWPSLGQALAEAAAGNATLISRQLPLAAGDAYADSYLYAGTAIACQDWARAPAALAGVRRLAALGGAMTPLNGGACQSWKIQASCIGWPARTANPPAPLTYRGDAPLLMVNSLYDPSTSYAWALGLQSELRNAVLLTRDGAGHTSYTLGGETTELTNRYLLDLTLPEPGTVTTS